MSTTTQDATAGSAAETESAEITGASVDGFKTHQVELSETAAEKVSSLLQQEGREDLRLRVAVQPGGCSGLIYQLYFDERVLDGDALRDFSGVEVVVDKMSVPYLEGAKIDFEDSISKQGFTIDNPNAGGSCACGDSFH
ncbi:HesB/IscA family protein [Nesterenkonia sandarakina]|uniref:Iron-sulfur cluster assembly accessory protein n=1 Tax=Nesterenkonia sandarakina TaxID=272918 RepID=A0A2T0YLK1_9MICC|nr:iron-sulfur cluster assembly accessory protein [Nesterenkonia sandarakina]PRZ16151.1 iron-sulfur cluster assembly accessory protein [Nesterenkonia sandarakina]